MTRRSALSAALLATIASPASLAASPSAPAQPEIVGLIVRYAPDAAAASDVRRAARELDAAGASIVRRLESRKGTGVAALSRPRLDYARRLAVGADLVSADRRLAPDEAAQARAALLAMPGVAAVEYDYLLQPALRPNDARYAEQWAYTDADAGLRAEAAWGLSTGSGVVVGVLDTGIAPHSDLAANVAAGYDFISNPTVAGDGDGRDANAADPGDFANGKASSWHGTHVAGIVAARANNAAGVAGLAFNARVLPVRVLGRGGGSTSDIADAIVWASGGTVPGVPTLSAANAADVLNLSLGGPGTCGATLQAAINSAASRGVPVVVAAGNAGADASGYTPANCSGVITVAAATAASTRAAFSNFGGAVDVTAPGAAILSTTNAGAQGPTTEAYASYSGTSMAAPFVAGTLALVQARRTALRLAPLTVAEQEALLRRSTYAPAAACTGCGAGLLSALAAVQNAGGTSAPAPTPPTPAPTPAPAPTPSPAPAPAPTPGASFSQTFLNLGGPAGAEFRVSIAIPSGARDLRIETSGGTGNLDLFVGAGSAPTTTQATCRSTSATNAEACVIAAPSATTHHVLVRGTTAFSGATLRISYAVGSATTTPATFANEVDVATRDNAAVASAIAVSGRPATLSAAVTIEATIRHPAIRELRVELVGPDGLTVLLHDRAGGTAANLTGRWTLMAPGRAANGTWQLRVTDAVTGNSGLIDRWSLSF